MNEVPSEPADEPRLGEVARVFLRLGFTAFGGPAAHVALMESEIVRRRRWLTHERFLDLFGAANMIPGPSSSELAVYIGYERCGLPGLLAGGACFILPAALMTAGLAWVYVRFGALPQVSGVLAGVKPVIIAIVAQAIWALAPKAVKSRALAVVGAAAALATAAALGVDAIVTLVGAGLLAVAASAIGRPRGASTPPNIAVLGAFDWPSFTFARGSCSSACSSCS